jgi:hypothetical protein
MGEDLGGEACDPRRTAETPCTEVSLKSPLHRGGATAKGEDLGVLNGVVHRDNVSVRRDEPRLERIVNVMSEQQDVRSWIEARE